MLRYQGNRFRCIDLRGRLAALWAVSLLSSVSVPALLQAQAVAPVAPQAQAVMPAGTSLKIRLRQTLSSFGSQSGSEVRAMVISPVEVDAAIVVPIGSELRGNVFDLRRVGIGFVRESAWIHVVFDSLVLPGGNAVAIVGRITDVDNARETVDDKGRIQGIRATASLSSTLSGIAVSATVFDPMLLLFGLTSSLSTFRIPESEIVLPTGTELHFETTAPLTLGANFPPAVGRITNPTAPQNALGTMVRDLPFRTATQTTNAPSDLTNLAFIGTADTVRRAFDAAGWVQTQDMNAKSVYNSMRSIVENQGFQEAPMSTLLLEGRAPVGTYAKTLNTIFERHHLRVFDPGATYEGKPVLTASSTRDSGVGFATNQRTFIHLIDENIDEEREKIVNDLILTGCVQAVERVERPWVPLDAYNSTGDRLLTDGRIAVVQLNDCVEPTRSDASFEPNGDEPGTKPSAPLRATRNTLLTMRNDLIRGNIFYQGYEGIRLGLGLFKKQTPGTSRFLALGGQQFEVVSGAELTTRAAKSGNDAFDSPTFQPLEPVQSGPENYETFLEFSFSGGLLGFGNDLFQTQPLDMTIPLPGQDPVVVRADIESNLSERWNVTANTTFNAHRHFSHEIGFTLNQTELRADLKVSILPELNSDQVTGAADIRQFNYALLAHLRPNGSRFRPYLAGGGGLQMIRLKESIQSENAVLKFAFKEANLLYSTYRFAKDPPLEGGGVLLPALHYGGGVKFHLTRRIVIRTDYRETLSAQPDFWTKSQPALRALEFPDGQTLEPLAVVSPGPLRQQRLSVGIGVTF